MFLDQAVLWLSHPEMLEAGECFSNCGRNENVQKFFCAPHVIGERKKMLAMREGWAQEKMQNVISCDLMGLFKYKMSLGPERQLCVGNTTCLLAAVVRHLFGKRATSEEVDERDGDSGKLLKTKAWNKM